MWEKITHALMHLCYPSFCLHCDESIGNPDYILCGACSKNLELIEEAGRCVICFSTDVDDENSLCQLCRKRPLLLDRVCASFDYIGPPASVIKKLKYGNQPYLAHAAGAWMATQLLRLNWSLPDVLVPVPISFFHKMQRGYNQSALLAQAIGKILGRPVLDILKKRDGSFSQAGLKKQQRINFEKKFEVRKPGMLVNKKVLLIDDVMTTGSTLRACAEILLEESPKNINAIVFCRASMF